MKGKAIHKQTIGLFVGSFVIVICILITCFFLYFYEKNNVGKSATVVFSYSDDASKLFMNNSTPITDEVGRNITFLNTNQYAYTEFSISSSMMGVDEVKYEIYAKNIGVAVEIPHRYVKLYLTDGDTDLPLEGFDTSRIPSFKDLAVSTIDPSAKKIHSGTLTKDEVKNFKLRMWLTDTYPITTEIRNFGVLLYVRVID